MTDGGRRFFSPEESFRFSQNDKRQWLRSTCWVSHLKQKSKGVGCFFFSSLYSKYSNLSTFSYFFFCFIINWRRKKSFLGLFKWRCIDCKTVLFNAINHLHGLWVSVSMWCNIQMSAEKNHEAQIFRSGNQKPKKSDRENEREKNRCHRIKYCECVHCALCLTQTLMM